MIDFIFSFFKVIYFSCIDKWIYDKANTHPENDMIKLVHEILPNWNI